MVSSSTCLFAIRRAAAAPGVRERRAPRRRAPATYTWPSDRSGGRIDKKKFMLHVGERGGVGRGAGGVVAAGAAWGGKAAPVVGFGRERARKKRDLGFGREKVED